MYLNTYIISIWYAYYIDMVPSRWNLLAATDCNGILCFTYIETRNAKKTCCGTAKRTLKKPASACKKIKQTIHKGRHLVFKLRRLTGETSADYNIIYNFNI